MPDVSATGVYSVEGQDEQANILAFGTPEAPQDDDSATDGGQAIDIGDYRQQAEQDEYRISPLDESRMEFQVAQAAQLVQQAEQEQAAIEQEQAYSEALENYDKLSPEEKLEVSTESVGRGLEAITAMVDFRYATAMNDELFAGQGDAVAMTSTLTYFAANAMETLQAAGIADVSTLTPEAIGQLNDPIQASLFAESVCGALGMPELVTHGVVNPQEMAASLLPWVPVLLSGNTADAYPPEVSLAFLQSMFVAFGQRAEVGKIDPAFAAQTFANWMKWGGHLGSELQRVPSAQPRSSRTREESKPARQTKSKVPRMTTNTDLFDSEMESAWASQHGGV